MRLGCCAGIEQNKILADIGYDYIELPLAKIMEISERDFLILKDELSSWRIKPEVCNVFFPSHLRLTGAEVDFDAVMRYVEIALARASHLGVDTIVFGSAGAKNVPIGFQKAKAWEQLVKMLKDWHHIALKHNIVITIEPLNRTESNIINTTREGLEIVKQVNCDNVRLLIDYYHFGIGMEDLNIIYEAAPYLAHVHVARLLGRAFPSDISEDDYEMFFEKLYSIAYAGRVSVEGVTKDLETDAKRSCDLLKSVAKNIGL